MQVDIPSCFVALLLKNCELPYPNHGHVILANPSPILLYRISSTEIRCLVDIPGKKVPSVCNGDMAHHLKTSVAPQVYIYTILFDTTVICLLFWYYSFKSISHGDHAVLTSDLVIQLPNHGVTFMHFRSPRNSLVPSYLQLMKET